MKIREQIYKLTQRIGRHDMPKNRQNRATFRRLLVEQMEDRRLLTTIDLATLTVAQGSTILGQAAYDRSGRSLSNAGDVNGDGFDDLIVGAYPADRADLTPENNRAGKSYVIFGGSSLLATIDLATLGQSGQPAGFTILGQAANDFSGRSVSSAGDVNGDGFDDVMVGAPNADPDSRSNAGKSYVIFGGSSLPATITLSDNLAATNPGVSGFTILGQVADDTSGYSVSNAGDVNGDGFDDLIIGADNADPGAPPRTYAGKSYVIFGKSDWRATPTITLSDNLGSTNPGVSGFTILGQARHEASGISVSSAGDVNGDGFDDLIVGASGARTDTPFRTYVGKSYVIFGGSSLPSTITLSDNLRTTNPGLSGFTILGQAEADFSGRSVSSAGDFNGDGFDDLIVGASGAAPANLPANSGAGKSYVIFGKADWSATPMITLSDNLSQTNPGVRGITILGQAAGDGSGGVSGAGDVNGDGFDDLIVGASRAGIPPRRFVGKSYVIFGKSDWSATPTITLSENLAATNPGVSGFTILGQSQDDFSGSSVSNTGDVNGDGFDDLIVGAPSADPANRILAGKSYVIFGGNSFTNSILPGNLGGAGEDFLLGDSTANRINGAGGNDLISGGGGADVLLGGQGNDNFVIDDASFQRIVGGTGHDSLWLNNPTNVGFTLDLTTIPDNRLQDIEEIDITGVSANNTLTLNHREVLNLSSSSNTLIVRRNAGDIVNMGSGWNQQNHEGIGGSLFEVYRQGQATLKVQAVTTAPTVVNRQVFYNNASGFGTSGANNSNSVNPNSAIDPSKLPLLPGETTTLANYTNYARGLNGIVVDLASVANLSGITASSFQFATWSDFASTTPNFVPIAPTVTLSTFPGGGVGGSDRVKLVFADRAIENAWLRITVLANASTGLATNSVFYFGNARGDVTPTSSFPSQVAVNVLDTNIVRARNGTDPDNVSNIYDVDKTGSVNALDANAVRESNGVASLRPFTAPITPANLLIARRIDSAFVDPSLFESIEFGSFRRRSIVRRI